MAFQLPSLPNFSSAIPQAPSPIDQYGRMLQLKSLLGQQQLIPLQVQEAQQNVKAADLQNQQRQLELQSQQAMVKAWSDPDFAKSLTGTPSAESSGVGFDPDAMTKGLIAKGVLPKDAMAMTGQFLERSKNIAEIYKTQQQGGEAQAAQREKGYKVLADQLGGIVDAPASKAGDMLMQLKADMVKNPQKYSGVPVEDLQHVIAADLEHLPAIATMIGLDGKIADFHKAKSDAAAAAQKVIPENGGLSPENQQAVQKEIAVATNPQVQAGKVAVASAEGAARGAQQVLTEVAKENALAPALDSLVQTTRAGRKYIDASQLPEKSGSLLRKQAAQAGIPVVTKDAADSLSQIDTAKANQQFMLDTIGKKLASGAPERLWYGPANTIEKMAQTDPEMAAVGTFRNAAIQSMRAVAGSKGLRINQAEIEMAIDNDIPKLTDTLPVAQAKLKNLQQFLENNEQAMLVRNRQQSGGAATVKMKAPNGMTKDVPADQVDHYKSLGATVVQ